MEQTTKNHNKNCQYLKQWTKQMKQNICNNKKNCKQCEEQQCEQNKKS